MLCSVLLPCTEKEQLEGEAGDETVGRRDVKKVEERRSKRVDDVKIRGTQCAGRGRGEVKKKCGTEREGNGGGGSRR